MIGIMCAMQEEIKALKNSMENGVSNTISSYEFTSGKLCGVDVVLCNCGVGKVNAALCTEAMILSYPVKLIINSGVAGSLRAPLEIGDIIVATDLVQHDVDTSALGDPVGFVSTVDRIDFPCSDFYAEKLAEAAKEIEGINTYRMRIASGDQFVTSAEIKQTIIDRFDAYACEMEGGPIAQVCHVNNVDCVVIRAISDSSSGQHQMEYTEFMPMAARNSATAVLNFLSKF